MFAANKKKSVGEGCKEIASPLKVSRIESLPKTLETSVMSYLTLEEQRAAVSALNTHFFPAIKNNDFLLRGAFQSELGKEAYQKELKALPFDDEIRSNNSQMIAVLLYRRATTVPCSEQMNAIFKKLAVFLGKYSIAKWTHYYYGIMYFYGKGVAENKERGMHHLSTALSFGDYRAARFFCAKLLHPQEKSEFEKRLKSDDFHLIKPCLLRAFFKQGSPPGIAREIGYAFLNRRLCAVIDEKEAEIFFRHALKVDRDPEAVRDLVDLYLKRNKVDEKAVTVESKIHPDKVKKTEKFLLDTREKFPHPEVANQLGNLYLEHKKDYLSAYRYFLEAAGKNGYAAASLADLYFRGLGVEESKETAKNWFERSFEMGVSGVAKDIARYMKNGLLPLKKEIDEKKSTETEVITWFKKGFKAGDIEACEQLINECYLLEENWSQDPGKVWWVMTSANLGSQEAMQALVRAENTSIFACYALCVMRGLAGEESDVILVDLAQVEEFRAAGEKEGLLTEEMNPLFERWLMELLDLRPRRLM